MATVYVATDLRLERRIALKVMHGHLSDDSVFQSRFIQEARAAARLADPHVVNVFDQGQDGELAYLVMEYLPGITLRELLKEQRRLSIAQTITVMDAILAGLAAAHRAGIVHRDVKPENVLLAEDGRIKIGDFGLARATTANTATGQQLMGTIAYLAPELVTRGTADARSDIYSLGIMLYEMLAGEQPYRGEQPMQIAFQHATESVPRPSVRNPAVPEQLDELVLWSTEREPDDRPADAQVMLDRLREIERELGISPVVTRREPSTTAGFAIPDDAVTGGLTTVMPLEPTGPALRETDQVDTTDNATRLRRVGTRARSRGGWLVLVTVLLALVAGGVGWYFGSGPGSQITIPDFAGGEEKATVAALEELELVPERRETSDLKIPAGSVVRTMPGAGSRVDAKTSVLYYISTGPAEAQLPAFRGMSEDDARTLLAEQHIGLDDPRYVFTEDVASGQVISVSVQPAGDGEAVDCSDGCAVHQGDAATMAVSRGSFPNVKGLTVDDARAKLSSAKLAVADSVAEVFSPDADRDRVAWVNGPDGRDWQEGDEVELVVSKGAVPDVAGKSEADARKALTDVGLKVADESHHENSDDIAAGNAIGIGEREGGGNWIPGDTVTLRVSDGPRMVTVPDVSGMKVQQAIDALRNADLVPIAAAGLRPVEGFWGVLDAGRTDPAAGTSLRHGSEVTIIGPLG